MVLAIPVVDGHDLTETLLNSLNETITGDNFEAVIFDNNSDIPYDPHDYVDKYNFPVHVMKVTDNIGYYAPIKLLFDFFDEAELIGLVHNDLVFYERGWNERMEHSYAIDKKLALVGLCGSSEIDERGGRGGGTVCYFRGGDVVVGDRVIRGQEQSAGRRTSDLIPSACLDSLFMMFRRDAIPDLVTENDQWDDLPLAHFYDRIWPVRLIEKGWHVATLGVECDHLGGMTTTGNVRYRDDCIKWLDKHKIPWNIREDNKEQVISAEKLDPRNIPCGNPETQMYLVAESRYLTEYLDQKRFIPLIVEGDYNVRHLAH